MQNRFFMAVVGSAVLSAFCVSAPHAQADELKWVRQTGDPDRFEIIRDQVELADGSFLQVGSIVENNDEGLYAVCIGRNGSVLWEIARQGSVFQDRGWQGIPTPDGGAILVSTTYVYDVPSRLGPWLLRVDAGGNVIWDSLDTFTPNFEYDGADAHGGLLPDGRIVIVGSSANYNTREERYIATISANGELLSTEVLPPIIGGWMSYTLINDAEATDDGGFVLAGSTGPVYGEPFVWKFSPEGEADWLRTYEDVGIARTAQSVSVLPDGGFVLTGADMPNATNTIVLRTDESGEPIWTRRYEHPSGDYTQGEDVKQLTENGLLLLLQTRYDAVAAMDVRSELVLLSAQGNVLRRVQIPGGSFATTTTELFVFDINNNGFLLGGTRNDLGPCQPTDSWTIGYNVPILE